jgi:hypothetical protein
MKASDIDASVLVKWVKLCQPDFPIHVDQIYNINIFYEPNYQSTIYFNVYVGSKNKIVKFGNYMIPHISNHTEFFVNVSDYKTFIREENIKIILDEK